MRIGITGAAGFIGSCIAKALTEQGGHDLVLIDHLGTSEKWKNLRNLDYSAYVEKQDFLEKLKSGELGDFDAIVHMGACSSTDEKNATYLMLNNAEYTKELFAWCATHDTRFIYASSAATYGDGSLGFSDDEALFDKLTPMNMYGYSKLRSDRWALKHKKPKQWVGLRFFNVYGPNEYHKDFMSSVVLKAYHQIKDTKAMKLFRSHREDYADGEQQRDFIYIKDAVKVMLFMLEHPEVSGVFNVGTGKTGTWNQLAKGVFTALGIAPNISYIDIPMRIRDNYQYYTCADMSKLRSVGYTEPFRDIEEGAKDYIEYLKNNAHYDGSL